MIFEIIPLKWKRPESIEYPKVWLRFKARDVDSDALVEYRIEDFMEDRINEAVIHMRGFFLKDEPFCQAMRKLLIYFPIKTN